MIVMRIVQKGFTIVELLIVIVVIGILAAITVVAYNGIQGRAHDVAVQGDLRNLYNKSLAFYASEGYYPAATDQELARLEYTASKGAYALATANLLFCTHDRTASDAKVAAVATSKSGKRFYVSSNNGQGQYTGATSMNDYVTICGEVLGDSNTDRRYGYSAGWRSWVN